MRRRQCRCNAYACACSRTGDSQRATSSSTWVRGRGACDHTPNLGDLLGVHDGGRSEDVSSDIYHCPHWGGVPEATDAAPLSLAGVAVPWPLATAQGVCGGWVSAAVVEATQP
jgi:hypothetical protein